MARIYPMLTETQLDELPSRAEATVYRCLRDGLDDGHVVIHGKSYMAPRRQGGHRDGEADFIIFSEKHGLLSVEVKGGGITYDPATGWFSTDRLGKTHSIKDPVAQARSHKYAVLNLLKSNLSWKALRRRISFGHAVFFPDLSRTSFGLDDCPDDIIGSKASLQEITGWIKRVFQYWEGSDHVPLGTDGLKIVEKMLCQPIDIRPLLRDKLVEDNKRRLRLTDEQAAVLRTLSRPKRAAIVGAAGTGKTILAVEKARMLSNAGAAVLLLCYNRALGVTLSCQFEETDKVLACTFHQYCQYCIGKCKEKGIQDPLNKAQSEMPNADKWQVLLPLAAFYAIEELGDQLQFDAIVIDEGQDFGADYWLPVEMALRDTGDSWLYIFYDENQKLYSRVSTFPVSENDTFSLTRNCRNSIPVHDLAYSYYEGEPVDDSGIDGLPPVMVAARTPQLQAKKIVRLVRTLIQDEGVPPESIAVLVAGQGKEQYYNLLKAEPLPKPILWSREEHFQKNSVLMDTVRRFKGLERDVVFLWLNQEVLSDESLMYVGISRAKSVLYVVGDEASLKAIKVIEDNRLGS